MICSYCGEFATTFDHVVPVSYQYNTRKDSTGNVGAIPSCVECNSTLGSILKFTVSSRANHLLKRYKQKYKKVLRTPVWEDDEFEDMGESFVRSIKARLDMAGIMKERINHLKETVHSDYTVDDCLSKFKETSFRSIRVVRFYQDDFEESGKEWFVYSDEIKNGDRIIFENYAIEKSIDILEERGVVTQGLSIEVLRL